MLGVGVSKTLLKCDNFEIYFSHREENQKNGENSFVFNANNPDFNSIPECDYIINCIGIIKPFMNKDMSGSIYVNSIFPRELAKHCNSKDIKLIHISTDCVYSGLKGKYIESDLHDTIDEYGKSKSLGEDIENSMVLRTSIIGEEKYNFASLLSWIKSQAGKEVNGFTNHYWNGVLTDYYGVICKQIIEKNLFENGLFHIHSEVDLTKCEILQLFNEKFNLGIKINPIKDKNLVDRTLRSSKSLQEKLNIPSFPTMVDQYL